MHQTCPCDQPLIRCALQDVHHSRIRQTCSQGTGGGEVHQNRMEHSIMLSREQLLEQGQRLGQLWRKTASGRRCFFEAFFTLEANSKIAALQPFAVVSLDSYASHERKDIFASSNSAKRACNLSRVCSVLIATMTLRTNTNTSVSSFKVEVARLLTQCLLYLKPRPQTHTDICIYVYTIYDRLTQACAEPPVPDSLGVVYCC